MIARIAAAILLSVTMAGQSVACRANQSGTSTLLDALPDVPEPGQVVARVEILEVLKPTWMIFDDWRYSPTVKVRVIEAIKGVTQGDEFVVEGRGTTCDQAFPRKHAGFEAKMAVWRPFIAGQFQSGVGGERIFRGAWRKGLNSGKWSPAP